jgi:hypothetical protein
VDNITKIPGMIDIMGKNIQHSIGLGGYPTDIYQAGKVYYNG